METIVLLEPERMPSRLAGDKDTAERVLSEKLYFFNPQVFFQAYLLSAEIERKMYKGLGTFVDSPAELWEANMWHSSIRISSGEFAFYLGVYRPPYAVPTIETSRYAREHTGTPRGPIFPSDFIRFQCSSSTQCECKQGGGFRHLGVVLAVAKDMRSG